MHRTLHLVTHLVPLFGGGRRSTRRAAPRRLTRNCTSHASFSDFRKWLDSVVNLTSLRGTVTNLISAEFFAGTSGKS